jgi:hypothetical protein
MGFGIWVSPHVMQSETIGDVAPGELIETAAPGMAPADRPASTANAPDKVASAREAVPRVAVSDPALHQRLAPVLNQGADVAIAAEGFADAAQFAAVAYAARNTGVPFMLLKHRVLEEGMTLADAIQASQPTANGVLEAERASAEAWSDLARLAG